MSNVKTEGRRVMTQLSLFKTWGYDVDNGYVMARCPDCSKRIQTGYYSPHNYYRYCPYCGVELQEGDYKSGAERRKYERKPMEI